MNNSAIYKGLDVLKLICALLIVPLHINPIPKDSWLYLITKTVGNLGVPCFFIMSGFFLFSKIFNTPESEHMKILRRQEKRLALILLFWMIPYFVVYDMSWIIGGENIYYQIGEYIRRIMFGGPGFFLWYIVSLMTAIAVCYYMVKLPCKWGGVITAILLVIGAVCSNGYRWIWGDGIMNSYIDGYNTLFTTTRNGLFFGLPCTYIGAMVAQYDLQLSWPKMCRLALIAIPLFVLELYACKIYNRMPAVMSPVIIMLSALLVLAFMRLKFDNVSDKACSYMRKSSLLIYLIHPLLIAIIPSITILEIDYHWYAFWHLQIPIIILLSTICGFCLIKGVGRFGFLKHIM